MDPGMKRDEMLWYWESGLFLGGKHNLYLIGLWFNLNQPPWDRSFYTLFFTCYHIHSQKLLRQVPVKNRGTCHICEHAYQVDAGCFDSTYIEPSKFNGYNVFDEINTKGILSFYGKLYRCSTSSNTTGRDSWVSCVDIASGAFTMGGISTCLNSDISSCPCTRRLTTWRQYRHRRGFRRPYDPKQLSWQNVAKFNCKLF